MTGIDIMTGVYIVAILLYVIFTETFSFEIENSTSNSFNHLGSDMVSGIVTNLVGYDLG